MAVSAPFDTAAFTQQVAVSPLDVPMTISGGHSNTALVVWVLWAGAGVTITSVTWDPAGANQLLTSMGAAVNFGSGVNNVQGFVLAGPTAGATKVIRIAYSALADVSGMGAVYDTVDQSTPSYNLTSNATGAPLAVTAASGDATTTACATSNTVDSTAGSPVATVLIDLNGGVALAAGSDYALATGTETHTWTASGSAQAVMGVALKQFSAGGAATIPLRTPMTLMGAG